MQHRAANCRSTVVNNKSHDLLLSEPRPAIACHPVSQSACGTATIRAPQFQRAKVELRPRKAQAAEGMPRPDRDETDFEYGHGPSFELISPSPPHGQDTRRCHHSARTQNEISRPTANRWTRTPLVGASALHGVSDASAGSHLGSTLRPGRAVLTRGVFRRSGSVACIRAEASPSEVLARTSWHRKPRLVKPSVNSPKTSAQSYSLPHQKGPDRFAQVRRRSWGFAVHRCD
jgi:hypothetical protein